MAESVDQGELREQHLGELVKELASQTSTLVRQELELAKAEMAQKGREAGVAAGLFGGAGVVAFLASVALTLVFIAALATAMQAWLAALIVTGVYLLIAGVLAAAGRQQLRKAGPPVPQETIVTLKEDVQWAKTRRQSAPK